MHLFQRARALAGWALAAVLSSSAGAGAAILTVTNINDGGAGSFRQAILDANGTVEGDLINFAIPGTGPHTIVTFAPLNITGSTLIDGYSQPGSVWNTDPVGDNAVLQVELLGQGTDGLVITGGAAIVQGLALYGFQTAIAVSGQPGVWVQGCFIGTDATGGETFIGNVTGVSITGTVGLDKIGDNYPGARNIISGNTSAGVLFSATTGKLVRGNLIGTDPTGTIALPNGTGIRLVDATGDKIGGIEAVERNVISGSFESGVVLSGGDGNIIQGNIIGADATGSQTIPNGSHGVVVEGLTTTFDILHNQISGNAGDGVHLDFGAGQTEFYLAKVTSNVIGMEFASAGALGNGGAGVRIVTGNNIEIWGNAIRHNQAGVLRMFPTVENGVVIRNNSIHDNVGEGIAFGAPGLIPPNQPNGFLNFPLIHFAVQDAESAWIYGFYRGRANAEVTLDFYLNPPCDKVRPGEFAEGKAFVWTMNVTTDSLGGYTFSFLIPLFDLQGRTVTATATTKIYSFSAGDGFAFPTYHTSAFSQRLPFAIAPRSGPASGGTAVTITGTNFESGNVVTIGGQPASGVSVPFPTSLEAQTPALAAGAAYDVAVSHPDGRNGTLALGWVADFLDVSPAHPLHDFVVTLVSNGVAGGTGSGNFGPDQPTLRQQMAVFLLKGKHGICYAPSACTGVFSDVPCTSPFAPWIEALAAEGITGGCGTGVYCPQNPVRRDQMAVFLLKAKYGAGYTPPPCSGDFDDVLCPSTFADWIEQLADENITEGCGGNNYCPGNNNTRGQMAVFLTKTFGLQ